MSLRLRDDAAWEGIEHGLGAPTVTTYVFELAGPGWTLDELGEVGYERF